MAVIWYVFLFCKCEFVFEKLFFVFYDFFFHAKMEFFSYFYFIAKKNEFCFMSHKVEYFFTQFYDFFFLYVFLFTRSEYLKHIFIVFMWRLSIARIIRPFFSSLSWTRFNKCYKTFFSALNLFFNLNFFFDDGGGGMVECWMEENKIKFTCKFIHE